MDCTASSLDKRFAAPDHHDSNHSPAGTRCGCAGGPFGHRRWRGARACDGVPAGYGPTHGARYFAFYLAAAHWPGGPARVLEAGPGGFEGRNSVRAWNAFWGVRRKPGGAAHAFAESERAIWVLFGAVGDSVVEKSAI